MKSLDLDNIRYEFDEDAIFEKDGKSYSFVSIKKITSLKDGHKKYQNLTISHQHYEKFKEWMREIVEVPF